jgi:ACT domain-containing protein
MRKVITAEQLRAYQGRSEVCFEGDAILTPSAQDVAREMGLRVRTGDCEVPVVRRNGRPVPALLDLDAPQGLTGEGDLVILSAFGQDRLGILAALTGAIAEQGGSVRDVSQTILQGYFSLILSVALPSAASFAAFKDRVKSIGSSLGLEVAVQRQAIFQAMHRI